MKNIFHRAFEISATERKSIIILVILIGILAGIQSYLAFHKHRLNAEDEKLLRSEMGVLQTKNKKFPEKDSSIIAAAHMVHQKPFLFDPNTADIRQLEQLGFNKRQIRNILNYRLKKGRFYKADDLKKIYGMDDRTYKRLSDYVYIEKKTYPSRSCQRIAQFSLPPKADMNLADTNALLRIRGIGPVLSSRIVRYRSLLGGFYSMEQLGEVYGLADSVIVLLRGTFTIDSTQITKVNINTISLTELMRHPYIGTYYARGIIRYREQVVRIKDISELKTNGLLPSERFEKVKRYLTN